MPVPLTTIDDSPIYAHWASRHGAEYKLFQGQGYYSMPPERQARLELNKIYVLRNVNPELEEVDECKEYLKKRGYPV